MAGRNYRWDIDGRKYAITLTGDEQALVDAIDLSIRPWDEHRDRHRRYLENKTPILALMSSLIGRGGIPEQRWRFWADPEYRIDRSIKDSPKGVFERNGNPGKDAYVHPHFIPYLRYFLFGAYLPSEVIEAFEKGVGNPDWITSGNIVPIRELARKLTRQHSLDRNGAALEFYKLCLDIGLNQGTAKSVRDSVMKIPRSRSGSMW